MASDATLAARVTAVVGFMSAIETAPEKSSVVAALEAIFALYDSTHWLVTELPMPGQRISSMILCQHWPDVLSGAEHRATADDLCFQRAIDWRSVFVLRAAYWSRSPMCVAAGLTTSRAKIEERDLLLVPIDPIYRMQGLAVLTFRKDSSLSDEIAMNNIGVADRSLIKGAVTAAFLRLRQLQVISGHRKGELTVRESETISWCALGLTTAQISGRMKISERTVIGHIQNAMLKLAASNRTECVVQAIRFNQIGSGTNGRRGFFDLRTEVLSGDSYEPGEVFR
jgi:DNA-binding CsgD family transcriptional regulator